jgi:hypothetical protein
MLRSDLHKKVREKFLFVGKISAGKTRVSLWITLLYAMNGKKVLYIDPEDGTQRDIDAGIFDILTDEQLANIELVHANNIHDYLKYAKGWEEDLSIGSQKNIIQRGHDYDLKICDGLITEMDMYKFAMIKGFIKEGFYIIGEKQFKISNPNLFTLPYQLYNKLYEQLRDVISTMMEYEYDIICTTHPFKETGAQQMLEQSIYGKFDTVVEFNKNLTDLGHPRWSGVTEKNRGRENPDKENTLASARPLLAYFAKKFNMPVEETLKKLKFKTGDEENPQVTQ